MIIKAKQCKFFLFQELHAFFVGDSPQSAHPYIIALVGIISGGNSCITCYVYLIFNYSCSNSPTESYRVIFTRRNYINNADNTNSFNTFRVNNCNTLQCPSFGGGGALSNATSSSTLVRAHSYVSNQASISLSTGSAMETMPFVK